MIELLLATGNQFKVKELNEIFIQSGQGIRVRHSEVFASLDIEENGATFEENAIIKARALSKLVDGYVVADDSGLTVESLEGAPGVRSARYAFDNNYDVANLSTDEKNYTLLLKNMEGVQERTASFVCSLALVKNGEVVGVFNGECVGSIADKPLGSFGFGYDPVFLLAVGRTMAMLNPDEKNKISHRRDAFNKLSEYLLINKKK